MKRTDCPVCGCDNLRDMWCRGRRLRLECSTCNWVDNERVPEQRVIKATRKVLAGFHGGHTFEVFDRYGHVKMSSRSYPTADEARAALEREIEAGRSNETAGPYTGILWPDTVLVQGEVIE